MAFWKPGTLAPGSQVDREAGQESEAVIVTFNEAQFTTMTIAEQRQQLPVFKHRTEFLYLLENYQVVILVGQTGSGKTTQIPQYLHETGWTAKGKVVGCTQPRRVAATTVAQRVAEEMHVKLGTDVGYVIRFEDCTDPGGNTRIKYMTDGMLFRETLMDPLLSKYSVVMLDEAHERSLYTDILMGVLKKMYPVDIHYMNEPCSDYVEQAIQTVFDIHTKEPAGDILVFMTGRGEIETVVSEIRERAATLPPNKYAEILVLPIYAGLQAEEQMLVFEHTERGTRKVVVATNVAEASITIPGIGYVVDSGFVKLRAYNPRTGMETLTTTAISQASADQRSGRAGRIKNGKAYRLYTEDCFQKNMRQVSVPEIQRSNLAGMVLQLKALGIENVLRFDFMTSPPAELMSKALELLYSLGALDEFSRLTIPLGIHLAEFPLDPLLGKILLDSSKFGCSHEILTIAAMVSVQAARIAPDGTHWISARELTSAGTANGQEAVRLWMHPTSILFKQTPTWVIFHEVVETGQGKAYMREVTVIEPEWLEELAPHFFTTKK
ncbi:ATPdependent RNA helicase [Podila epicladia]|nr:ATPdependent RNA helicase [Podila epicladia]